MKSKQSSTSLQTLIAAHLGEVTRITNSETDWRDLAALIDFGPDQNLMIYRGTIEQVIEAASIFDDGILSNVKETIGRALLSGNLPALAVYTPDHKVYELRAMLIQRDYSQN